MRMTGMWAIAAAVMLGGALQEPTPTEAPAASTPPTVERPNGDYYGERFLCPDDVPVNARRGTMKIASNNRQVDAMVYTPREGRNGALIVMLHGAQGLRSTLPAFDPRALQLASRGYVVIMPQYYDATSSDPERDRRNMDRWRDVADDVATGSTVFAGVDPGKVGVWGFSLGGWLAAEGAMRHDTLRSAVAVAAGADVAPARSFRREVPILMVNADGDPVISSTSGRELATELRRRGAEVESLTLNSSQHFLEQPLWCQTFTASREFFDRTLLAP